MWRVAAQAYERRTKVLSRRMRRLFKDPKLREKRIAAIKAGKANEEYRRNQSEKRKLYFADPERRLQHSRALTGQPFHCKKCGGAGHRSHFCPLNGYEKGGKKRARRTLGVYSCGQCGEKGHTRRSCTADPGQLSQVELMKEGREGEEKKAYKRGPYRCATCHQLGHSAKACTTPRAATSSVVDPPGAPNVASDPTAVSRPRIGPIYRRGPYKCSLCGQEGHVRKSCSQDHGNQGALAQPCSLHN